MKETRKHQISREFEHPAATVFAALIIPRQIQRLVVGRSSVIPKTGGIRCAAWGEDEDVPDYTSSATIKEFQPDCRLVLGEYQYVSPAGGLPFEADFETTFEVKFVGEGSQLTVTQAGFPSEPIADEYYGACESGWQRSLDALENYLDR